MRHHVFLSYNRLEKASVSLLDRRLSEEGFSVYRDDRVAIPGTSLPNELLEAVRGSLACVVIMGPSGIGDWQRTEIDVALQKSTEDPQYRFFAVLLPGASRKHIPAALAHRVWVDFSAGLEDEQALRKLFEGVRGTLAVNSAYAEDDELSTHRSMALPPEEFVHRPELARLLEALTRTAVADSPDVTLTTALRGAGGFGKTALAQAACDQRAIRERFRAGILWTTLGERITEAQRISRIADLLKWWTRREPPSFETVDTAAATLREALSGQRVLVVVDDVWAAYDLQAFAGFAPPAAVLVTTRNTRAVPPAVPVVTVDALDLPTAGELLGQGLTPQPAVQALRELATRLGEWPILLRLVNAQLREEYRDGADAATAFRMVEDALDEVGLTAFDREDEQARNLAVRRTVEASLQRLSSEDRQSYSRLAVFAEDEVVPLPVLELLWHAERAEVYRRCRRLAQLSLLYRFSPKDGSIQLHDVMTTYLQREHNQELPAFHGELVDTHLQAASPLGSISEDYFLRRLAYHLSASERENDLEDLLFSYSWLDKKVRREGVNYAMADYGLLRRHQQDADAVKRALLLSRSILTTEPSQLSGQLTGRLERSASARVEKLLSGAVVRPGPWLRPLTASLQKPTGALLFSLSTQKGETCAITAVDNERFATATSDGALNLWSFESGELSSSIPSMGARIQHLASPGPNRLLAASDDGTVRLWDLEEATLLRSFAAHGSSITALHVRQEEFISGSEDGRILRWSLSSDKPLASYVGHEGGVTGLAFMSGRTIVSVGKDRTMRVWNLQGAKQIRTLVLPGFPAEALIATASNEVILGTFAGEIQVWKPLSRDLRPRRSLRHRAVGLGAMAVLGRDLGVTPIGGQSSVQLWNPSTGVLGPEVHVPGGGVTSLARFGADHLLCGSKEGLVSVWSIAALRAQMFAAPTEAVYGVAAVNETTAVSTSTGGRLNVWNLPGGELLRSLEGAPGRVGHVCALGHHRVAASSEHMIRIWNPHTGELLSTLHSEEKIGTLAPFGENLLISAPADPLAKDQRVRIWDLARGQSTAELPAIPGGVASLCSIRGRYLIVGTYSGLVVHLDISASADHRNFALRGHERGVVALSAVGQDRLASGSLDTTIRIWDLRSQKEYQLLEGHNGAVTGLVFITPQLLVSASQDQSIKVWRLDAGEPVASFQMDTGISALTVLGDQRTLVAGDAAGSVHFIKLEIE